MSAAATRIVGLWQLAVAILVGCLICTGAMLPPEIIGWISEHVRAAMWISAIIAMMTSCARDLAMPAEDGPLTREYIAAKAAMYASLTLMGMLMWNWTRHLYTDAEDLRWMETEIMFTLTVTTNGFWILRNDTPHSQKGDRDDSSPQMAQKR